MVVAVSCDESLNLTPQIANVLSGSTILRKRGKPFSHADHCAITPVRSGCLVGHDTGHSISTACGLP
jgi:hypothetical protein